MKTTIITQEENIALAVMRLQPLHNGHFNLISKMLRENQKVIIGLGSTQIENTFDNPFSGKQRLEMLKIAFGNSNKLKIIFLKDIGAVVHRQWAEYVFSQIEKNNLPLPTRYYAGSLNDAFYFEDFNINKNDTKLIGDYEKYKDISFNEKYKDLKLEIKILDRRLSSINDSGTEIRKSIVNNIDTWLSQVPECLHNYIISNFPKKFDLLENIKANLN